MSSKIGRRELIGAAGAAIVAGAISGVSAAQDVPAKKKIIGISCSPRKGKTTAAALKLCLAAAEQQGMTTELIELADLGIPAQVAAGMPLRNGETDDFPKLVEKLGDPVVAGIIVGSPVYFSNMSALCKAFLDRCMAFRKDGFKLRNKIAGVVAVGGTRNGGQELTVHSIQAALMGQDMILVGDGQPSGRIGATFMNTDDSIDADEFGKGTGERLGRRVAELAGLLKA